MRVIGVAEVERSGKVLQVARDDLVTPLARERASDLGISIEVVGSQTEPPSSPGRPPTPRAERPRGDPPGHLTVPAPVHNQATGNVHLGASGSLYRRGAPVAAAPPHPQAKPLGKPKTPRVTVVGAGRVGALTAARLAEADVFSEVLIVDLVPGLAEGTALDIWHSAPLHGFSTRVRGAMELSAGGVADFVVVTAGRTRQPGMSRTELTEANAAIVKEVAEELARHSPQAIVVVVTNPLDEMTELVWRTTGFPASRVMGMAGVLDAARFAALTSLAWAGRPNQVSCWALGSHGEEMVIPLSSATAAGTPVTELLDDTNLDHLVQQTRDSGAEIVRLLRTGSAHFAPAAAVARMVLTMVADEREVLPACVRADGTYGVRDVYLGLPARLGRGGVLEIVELPLTPYELEMLQAAASRIGERVRQVD
jgi:malate dehydrogenase